MYYCSTFKLFSTVTQYKAEAVQRSAREGACAINTVVPITKLFAWGEGDSGGHVTSLRDDESRPVLTSPSLSLPRATGVRFFPGAWASGRP